MRQYRQISRRLNVQGTHTLIVLSTPDLSYPLSPSPFAFCLFLLLSLFAFIPLAFTERRSTKCDLSTFQPRLRRCFNLLETETEMSTMGQAQTRRLVSLFFLFLFFSPFPPIGTVESDIIQPTAKLRVSRTFRSQNVHCSHVFATGLAIRNIL